MGEEGTGDDDEERREEAPTEEHHHGNLTKSWQLIQFRLFISLSISLTSGFSWPPSSSSTNGVCDFNDSEYKKCANETNTTTSSADRHQEHIRYLVTLAEISQCGVYLIRPHEIFINFHGGF